MALETFAMERAVRNLTKANRDELRKACETMHAMAVSLRTRRRTLLEGRKQDTFLTAHLTNQLLLHTAASTHLAIKIVTNVYQRNLFFGQYSHKRDLRHVAWAWRQHAEVERAIRRGDPSAAARWMHAHISWSMADALTAFDAATAAATRSGRAPSDPVHDALAQITARFT